MRTSQGQLGATMPAEGKPSQRVPLPGATQVRAVRWTLAILLTLTALPAAGLIFPPTVKGSDWLMLSLTSRQFLTCSIVLLLSTIVVISLCWVMWQAGAADRLRCKASSSHLGQPQADRIRQLHESEDSAIRNPQSAIGESAIDDGQGGTAIVEFALVMPIVLMFSLLMVQAALLMAGNVCVHYAAFCAARSAIVTVPLNFSQNQPPEPMNTLGSINTDTMTPKLARIKSAAVWALTPVSCGSELYPSANVQTIQAGISGFYTQSNMPIPVWVNYLPHRWQYAQDYTHITIDAPGNGVQYGIHEDIVVKLEHTFYLSVPFASKIFGWLSGPDTRDLNFAPGEVGTVIRATCRLPNEGLPDGVDIEKFQP